MDYSLFIIIEFASLGIKFGFLPLHGYFVIIIEWQKMSREEDFNEEKQTSNPG